MKKTIFIIMSVFLMGCTYEGEKLSSYFESPRSIIQDPHFMKYKEKRDALEVQYLEKEITYAEYIQQIGSLDDEYNQEVQRRDAIIRTHE